MLPVLSGQDKQQQAGHYRFGNGHILKGVLKNGVVEMRKKEWYAELEKDDLEIAQTELQELDGDELSLAEAAFYSGYIDSYYEEDTEDYY